MSSPRPFVERIVVRLDSLCERIHASAEALAADAPERTHLMAMHESTLNFKRVLLEELQDWEQSRGGPPPPPGALTRAQVTNVLGSIVSGLVQISDVPTVRDAFAWFVANEQLWESMRQLEGAQVEAH